MPPRLRTWRAVVPVLVVALVGLSVAAITGYPEIESLVSGVAIAPAPLQDDETPGVRGVYELERSGMGFLPLDVTDVELPPGFLLVQAGVVLDDGEGAVSSPDALEQAVPLPARIPAGTTNLVLAWNFDCPALTAAVRADPGAWVAQLVGGGFGGPLRPKPIVVRSVVLGVFERERAILATPEVSLEDVCGVSTESLGLVPIAE